METLTLTHVAKRFGTLPVLDDVSFSVPEHAVFGLIGKNGAGKTTTMKLILGFLPPAAGEIQVCGKKVVCGEAATNRLIGYLPDVPEFYGYMTPREYLRFCGQIAGMKPARLRDRSEELLEMVGLAKGNRRIHGFSRGMKQRLGIAQALLNEPRLLICDEPTSALDPVGRREILDLLALAGQKTAILFSTHILSDVERICDHIAILHQGKIALQGRLTDLKDSYRQDSVRMEFSDENAAGKLADACRQLPFSVQTSVSTNTLTVRLPDASVQGKKLLELVVREQAPLLKYEILEPTLEDLFLEVVK